MSVVESCGSQLAGRDEENVGAKPISRISQRRTEGELRKRAGNSPGDMELWKTKFGRLPEMGWWRWRRRATTTMQCRKRVTEVRLKKKSNEMRLVWDV